MFWTKDGVPGNYTGTVRFGRSFDKTHLLGTICRSGGLDIFRQALSVRIRSDMRFGLAGLILNACVASLQGQPSMPRLWRVDLPGQIRLRGSGLPTVWALSFSPDEKALAVGIADYDAVNGVVSRLMTIPVDSPTTVLHQVRISTPRFIDDLTDYARWTALGDAIEAGRFVIRTSTDASCEFQGAVEVLDGGPELARDAKDVEMDPGVNDLSSARFIFSDSEQIDQLQIASLDCRHLARWKLPQRWLLTASSPKLNLIALTSVGRSKDKTDTEQLLLVDARTLTEVRRTTIQKYMFGFNFIEQGEMICGTFRPLNWNDGELNCWNVWTGTQISSPKVRTPGRFSAGGLRVATSEYKIAHPTLGLEIFLDIGDPLPQLKDRMIWDFTSQRALARWAPRKQRIRINRRWITTHDAFGLSASGKFYAEGGAGSVSVYRVE